MMLRMFEMDRTPEYLSYSRIVDCMDEREGDNRVGRVNGESRSEVEEKSK